MKGLLGWLKKYFIPHTKNDYEPHFLRSESMMFFLLIIIVVQLGFLAQVFIVFDKTNFLASVLPGVLTSITNEERAANDAAPLVQSDLLAKAAQMKANDMATNGYFAHTSPAGKTPWYWFDQVGYLYTRAGENLAVNFFESNDVAQAWMNSPSHRANIVNKNYTEIGIGVASGIYEGKNTVFVAELFGAPIKITPASTVIETKANPAIPPKLIPKSAPKVVPSVAPPVVVVNPIATKVLGEETVAKILTSPRQYVNYIYSGIALLILLSIFLALFIKFEIKRPLVIARGLALVAIIILLFFVNLKMLHLKTDIGMSDATANAIDSMAF